MLAFTGMLSPWHWLFILIVAVLLFGHRLPEIARSLGRSVNEFKRGLKEVKDDLENEMTSEPPREKLPPRVEPKKLEEAPQAEQTTQTQETHTPQQR